MLVARLVLVRMFAIAAVARGGRPWPATLDGQFAWPLTIFAIAMLAAWLAPGQQMVDFPRACPAPRP